MRSKAGFAIVSLALVTLGGARAETLRERGAYIVNALAACAGCHTPKMPEGLRPTLSGGSTFGGPASRVYAPNITPDRQTGIGAWTDGQMFDAIKLGIRPDGSRIGPSMPQIAYRSMSDEDAQAAVVYLRGIQPISHAVPRPDRPKIASTAHMPPRMTYGLAPNDTPVAKGRYLAIALSHCTECHTPVSPANSAPPLDEGGRVFITPKGAVVAPGITAKDLARFTDAQLAAIITKGVQPDGRQIEGPMPFRSFAGYKGTDLKDLLAFLRSDQKP